MNTTIIGKNIKNLRDERGITQQQLSEVLGVSFQTISKWECNTTSPDISILPDIADYFEVTIDSLFTANANPYRNKAERLADKYGHDVEKSDVFFQAENEFQKMFTTENHDRTDLKNYAYLNACRMKYYLNKAEKNYLDVIAAGEKVKDELYYQSLTAYILFLTKLGRTHERVDVHKEMLRKEPDNVSNHETLIFAYIYDENYKEALAVCENAIEKFPENTGLNSFMGSIQSKLKNFDEAVKCWEKAWALKPDYVSDLYSLAFYYRDSGQSEKAIETFKEIFDWLESKGYREGMKFVKSELRKLNTPDS